MGDGASTGRERSTVLVVDDDAKLRELLARMLRFGGYDVAEAASAEQAITQIAESNARIAAVLTDLEMPGMGGDGLIAHIQREWLGLPVLVLTGGPRRIATLSPERQLAKPAAPKAILDAISGAIRTARSFAAAGDHDVHVVTLDIEDLIELDDDDDPAVPSR
jgi:two-component system response regulator FlrC